ncbi:MAG: alanine--tRNA ligase [Pseudomonadota bacterium]|nr:alanine--tRNA ligase [Pseudomonadota bacterium]
MLVQSTQALRKAFIDYFKSKQHAFVPSASLIPVDDDTLLFTNAGMVPFKQYFLGQSKPPFSAACSVQRCLRVGGKHNDLDNVGYTSRHHTLFEMLGNFSFGAYGKREAIAYAMDFLVNVLKIDKARLWVTVYHDDKESENIWLEEQAIPKSRLVQCGEKDNFWSMGDTGPCGPCTEIFYDHGEAVFGGPPGSKDEDGDRFVEIWNIVFMQYDKQTDGQLKRLPHLCVDTGMGLERIAAVMQNVQNNFEVDVFKQLIGLFSELTTKKLNPIAERVMADHLRAIAWMIADGIRPGNEGRSYVLRRVIRRALRYAYTSGLDLPCLHVLIPKMAVLYEHDQDFIAQLDAIADIVLQEEESFSVTIKQGLVLFDQAVSNLTTNVIPGDVIFKLYDTYGFPYDLVADLARERGFTVDEDGFDACMHTQRERSRRHHSFAYKSQQDWGRDLHSVFCGYESLEEQAPIIYLQCDGHEQTTLTTDDHSIVVLEKTPFYAESGGQIGDRGTLKTETGVFIVEDTQKQYNGIAHYGYLQKGTFEVGQTVHAVVDSARAKIAVHHTATHLLHAALRAILGTHVVQKGSLVTADKLRFDFLHSEVVDLEDLLKIELLVNYYIAKSVEVETKVMPFEDAKKQGVMALFAEKYQERVRVLRIGDFSSELCGGTHVTNTGQIGFFAIKEESSVAQGIRRVEAVCGAEAIAFYQNVRSDMQRSAQLLGVRSDQVFEKVQKQQEQITSQQKKITLQSAKLSEYAVVDLLHDKHEHQTFSSLVSHVSVDSVKNLRVMMDACLAKMTGIVILTTLQSGNKLIVAIGVSKSLQKDYSAGNMMRTLQSVVAIKGGGKPAFAQGSCDCEAKDVKSLMAMIEDFVLKID